jgi:hypothetical protein
MNDQFAGLPQRIRTLEDKLELAKRRRVLRFAVHEGKVRFEQAMLARHRAMRTHVVRDVLSAGPMMLLAAPLIDVMLLPLAVLDLFLTVYHAACLPVYGVETVRPGDYLIFDRNQLAYLNAIEKLNCAYCSYANGLSGTGARSPVAPSSTGARSSTPGGWSRRTCTTPRSSTTAMRRTISRRCRTCAGLCVPLRIRHRTTAVPTESHCGKRPRLRTGGTRTRHEVARRSDFLDPPRVRPDNRLRTLDAGRSGRAVEHRRRRGATA